MTQNKLAWLIALVYALETSNFSTSNQSSGSMGQVSFL
jgi:hypothetical protein